MVGLDSNGEDVHSSIFTVIFSFYEQDAFNDILLQD